MVRRDEGVAPSCAIARFAALRYVALSTTSIAKLLIAIALIFFFRIVFLLGQRKANVQRAVVCLRRCSLAFMISFISALAAKP